MAKNRFIYKSFVGEIDKEIRAAEKKVLKKAAAVFKKQVKSNIENLGLVEDSGALLSAVASDIGTHGVWVGMDVRKAPHALLIELGSYISGMRKTRGEGQERKGVRETGVLKPRPFFLRAFSSTYPQIQKILSEEWI